VIERDYDIPREIVWDALVDEDLVSGWIAEARIEPRVGGRYDLTWMHPTPPPPPSTGEILDFAELERLEVVTNDLGTLTFELEALPGGTRGSSTLLRLTVDTGTEPAFAPAMKAYFLTDLDQLDQLLRGHPVDWANWERDHQEAWEAYWQESRFG
jgi:uncharacterized protein YndB with AHSA1/START domain